MERRNESKMGGAGVRSIVQYATALIVAIFICTVSASAQNVLTNAGFENPNAAAGDVNGSTNWGAFNDAYTHADALAHSGAQDLKVFGPFFQGGGAGVVQGGFAATPGSIWQASAFLRSNTNDVINGQNFAVVKIEFLNAGNGVITGVESPHFTAADPKDVWVPEVVQAVAPANTASAQIVLVHVQINNPVTGGAVLFDDASLSVVPEPSSLGALAALCGGVVLRRRRSR